MVTMETNLHKSVFQPHLCLPENQTGRDFLVSDLHGHRPRLDTALLDLNFDFNRDRLIAVGDLIDRGPDSQGCLALLQEPWFWSVRGNHEQMLIDTVREQSDSLWRRWLLNGGGWALDQPDILIRDWALDLAQLPLTLTLDCRGQTLGVCHAEYSGADWGQRTAASDQQVVEWLWGRSRLKLHNNLPIEGVDWVFSGHTVVPEVQILGNSVFIERGAYLDNPLTVIDLQQWLLER